MNQGEYTIQQNKIKITNSMVMSVYFAFIIYFKLLTLSTVVGFYLSTWAEIEIAFPLRAENL